MGRKSKTNDEYLIITIKNKKQDGKRKIIEKVPYVGKENGIE